MSSPLLLFGGATVATMFGLSLVLTPRAFQLVLRGSMAGVVAGGTIVYVNRMRHHSMNASFKSFGISAPPANFAAMQPVIYKHLSQEYESRGELDLGEESITVQPNVFAQIGIIDVDGIRQMWTKFIIPCLKESQQKDFTDYYAKAQSEVESKIVFCDIGSGVGNVCLQVLSETECRKTVGIEIIPSRVRASEEAVATARRVYPDIIKDKEAVWLKKDLVDCADRLREEGVNVIFTHSWMFDDDLMTKMTEVIAEVPSVSCVVTSRKLDEGLLSKTPLKLKTLTYLSADWNDEAPFYVYGK